MQEKTIRTVLAVDDEEFVLDLIGQMLQEMEMEVLTAASGAQALEVFDESGDRISLVLLDMVLPGMSGSEIARAIREKSQDVKIVMLSGMGGEEMDSFVRDNRISAFIRKPFGMDELCETVLKVIHEPIQQEQRSIDDEQLGAANGI